VEEHEPRLQSADPSDATDQRGQAVDGTVDPAVVDVDEERSD
jgi:hypothetical protein